MKILEEKCWKIDNVCDNDPEVRWMNQLISWEIWEAISCERALDLIKNAGVATTITV